MADTRLVYSTGNPCLFIDQLMDRCDQDVDKVILALSGKSCSRATARQLSEEFAECLGLTPLQFMRRWKTAFLLRTG